MIFTHVFCSSNECDNSILICTYSCSKIENWVPDIRSPSHDNNMRTV